MAAKSSWNLNKYLKLCLWSDIPFFGFQVWSTGGRSHKQCNGCGRFSVSSKLRKIRLIPVASEIKILTLAWNSEKTRREEKAENSRVKGGKLGARTRVCLCAHFVHKLTVVGVFISDLVECRQFRNQVSSQFNLQKLQYWLTWKRIHGAFGQGKFQHYSMVKKVIFFLADLQDYPEIWTRCALWFCYGIICAAGILKEKTWLFEERMQEISVAYASSRSENRRLFHLFFWVGRVPVCLGVGK